MGIDPAEHFKVLISVILILTLLGLLLIICLLMLWRRFNALQNRPMRSQTSAEHQSDLWREAGQRMAHPPREEDEDESDQDPRTEDGRD